MKGYTCDGCGGIHSGRAPVKIKGVSAKSGILLPEPEQRRTFCKPSCFWRWAWANLPESIKAS